MAQSITPSPVGDTPKVIEDKTRALPINQGLNEHEMWLKIDTEVAEAQSAGKFRNTEGYPAAGTNNKHGAKK